MSISGISNISSNQHQVGNPSTYQQSLQQFSQALQSGNASAAQSDFAALQQAFSQPANPTSSNSSSATSSPSTPTTQALKQLASDLQSGNISAAQQDYTTLQQDLRSQGGPAKNHFHHHDGLKSGGDGSSNQSSLLQDLSQVGQSILSGSLAAAQQAYLALQPQFSQLSQLSFNGAPPSQTESPVSLLSNAGGQSEPAGSASLLSLVG